MLANNIPEGWSSPTLAAVGMPRTKNLTPSDYPDEVFELWSVPSYPSDSPEVLKGSEIGSTKQVVQEGDVLLCKINPRINRVWQVGPLDKHRQIASSEWIVIRNEEADSRYLQWALRERSFRRVLCDNVSGVGGSLTRARPREVKTYTIPVPPLPEQRRIVARLDAIEAHRRAAKETLDQLPDLLDRYRQSVLAAAFRGDLTASWREAHPDAEPADSAIRSLYRQRWIANRAQTLTDRAEARDAKKGKVWTDATRSRRYKTETVKAEKSFALPDPVQVEDYPGLPEGWSWMTLEEIVDPARGLCYGVVQPGKDPGEGVPLIRVQDLLGEHIDRGSLRRIEPAIDDQYERSRVEPGDVLVSLVGTIGRVATVDAEVGYANIARAVGRVSALCGLGEWIALCLQAPQIQDWLQRESREVARKTLNLGTLSQAAIPVPPLAEAAQAVSQATGYLQRGRAIMSTALAATERVENLRQSTLARAFRGELVPTEAALARRGCPPAPAASEAATEQGRGDGQTAFDFQPPQS